MYKSILLALLLVLTVSCQDKQKIWLKEYQKAKCSWAKREAEFKTDSIHSLVQVGAELLSIKKESNKISEPISSKIAVLKHKINEINIKYLDKSRKISQAQEQVYGHNSTPEFEKKTSQNDQNNTSEVQTIENEIVLLQSELNNDKNYQELISRQNKIQQQIIAITNTIKEKYAVPLDSLQKIINDEKDNFRAIMQDLNQSEKQKFIEQRDKIIASPCEVIK